MPNLSDPLCVSFAGSETCMGGEALIAAVLVECCFYLIVFFGGWAALKAWWFRKAEKRRRERIENERWLRNSNE